MPYNKSIATVYSLGSTTIATEEEDEDEMYRTKIHFCGLHKMVFLRFSNYTTWIGLLMEYRALQFVVQEPLLTEEYFTTGKYDYDKVFNLCNISLLTFISTGHIQQVTIAALQILYDVGYIFDDTYVHEGDDHSILYYYDDVFTSITISFKFNNFPVSLKMIEQHRKSKKGEEWKAISTEMTLYIKD